MKVEKLPETGLYRRAAELFVDSARRSIVRHGLFTVALAGGSTPKALYSLLASEFGGSVNWTKTQVFFSDERCVPPDHDDSNFRMASEALLSRVAVPVQNVHRMRGEIEPEAASASYAAELRTVFYDAFPRFDLILLGIGDDCHTASIFPHTRLLSAAGNAVAATHIEHLHAYRLTLTPLTLKSARLVIVMASGRAKAEAVREAIEDPFGPDKCPAQILRQTSGEVVWLIDHEAGALLQ